MRPLLLLSFILLAISCKNDQTPPSAEIDAGVPLDMAKNRKAALSAVTYDLHFTVPPKKEEAITAKENLTFIFKGDGDLYVDFSAPKDHLHHITANGSKIDLHFNKEHIRIPEEHLHQGKNEISIDFWAGDLSLNRNDDFLYTLLVPDRARTLFPCFDQPNIKATYNLSLTVPADWKVLSSTAIEETTPTENATTFVFATSPKMSTYLFSFVAGKFQKKDAGTPNFPMSFLYRETDTVKVTYSETDIFALHTNAIAFLEDYTQREFPFPKLDFACIPGFQYGGMEHVGAIQYRERALMLDASATANQLLARAKLIAHETAHMWFGDLVTMDWFNDVWMKEVFANFMADKIVNPAFPEINHDLAFMTAHYPRAYAEDRTLGTNPIRQPLNNLNNAGSLYGSIIYNKAPIMMRQLELLMGKEAFANGIAEYISKYAYGNATWPDLIAILNKRTPIDLDEWSQVWVHSASRPVFKEAISYDANDRISKAVLTQEAENGTALFWPQQFEVALIYTDSIMRIPVAISQKEQLLTELHGKPKPLAIQYNANGYGYGVFPVKDIALAKTVNDPVSKAAHYINLYENTLNGNLNVQKAMAHFYTKLTQERDPLLMDLLGDYATQLFWHYLPDNARQQAQETIAPLLWKALNGTVSGNSKKILYANYKSVAYTGKALDQLYGIWKSPENITGLVLNNRDRIQLAMDLTLYGHPATDNILKIAEEGISNPDERERFQFLMPSLSPNAATRAAFHKELRDPGNREKEAWAVTALGFLHHPLRATEALAYLPTALELLPEIQKTGDIFFPKRWLVASVGQHTSKEAYAMVETYSTENPDLEPSLVSKLWQAADDLRRVQELSKN